jgi:hypothetical protein
LWQRWTTEVEGTARAAVGGNDLLGVSAVVGSGGNNDNGRQGQTLTSKGREQARQRWQARTLTGKGQVPAATTTAGKGGR